MFSTLHDWICRPKVRHAALPSCFPSAKHHLWAPLMPQNIPRPPKMQWFTKNLIELGLCSHLQPISALRHQRQERNKTCPRTCPRHRQTKAKHISHLNLELPKNRCWIRRFDPESCRDSGWLEVWKTDRGCKIHAQTIHAWNGLAAYYIQ